MSHHVILPNDPQAQRMALEFQAAAQKQQIQAQQEASRFQLELLEWQKSMTVRHIEATERIADALEKLFKRTSQLSTAALVKDGHVIDPIAETDAHAEAHAERLRETGSLFPRRDDLP